MPTKATTYRVSYGDTDQMGYVYYANYLRLFEIGRAEYIRQMGVTYKTLENRGIFLPVAEAFCKYNVPARYDDLLLLKTSFDPCSKGAMRFSYEIQHSESLELFATGWTRHAVTNHDGRVIRPPKYLRDILADQCEDDALMANAS